MQTTQTTLPSEVQELAVKLPAERQKEVTNIFTKIFEGTKEFETLINQISVKDEFDLESMKKADEFRLKIKKERLNLEKLFDSKRDEIKELKSEFDLADKIWLKGKQVMQITLQAIEEKAQYKADFAKRLFIERKELQTQKRMIEVSKYAQINRADIENMNETIFLAFLNGLKKEHEAKIKAQEQAEKERLEKEQAEKKRIELQRIENEKLKAEAQKREKELEAQKEKARLEAEKTAKEYEAKIKREQAEKAKIEAELLAQKEKEKKEKEKREAQERQAKLEADKLAKAPIKQQLLTWIDTFSLPSTSIQHIQKTAIEKAFFDFVEYAKKQVENI